ncbi:MAG: GNAT family N-acetyltransferase [Myxococcales bacterium]|nr:GNAT family N-acetyltransferase [Myxococcales bacterium]
MQDTTECLRMTVLDRVGDVASDTWDRMLGEGTEVSPFLEHAFLTSLEDADTLELKTGWIPRIPILLRGERVVAAVPAYIKLHSFGEFVFDHSWAHFAERNGVRYYPKLLVGVPFTPVSGRRFLTAPGEDRSQLVPALGQALCELSEAFECSSVHINFATADEVAYLEDAGYLVRHGIQYHWQREGAASFSDYLARFNSKRRNQLKRELRAPEEQGITLEVVRGEALGTHSKLAFDLYLSTVEKFVWGRQYLNQKVFELWVERMSHAMELVLARQGPDGEVVAGAINFSKGSRMYGRYWGCFKEFKHLHFNVCYYRGIQECVERQIDVFEPGAGGDHKLVRAFAPTKTFSAHWLVHPGLRQAIAEHLAHERAVIEDEQAVMKEAMGTKKDT